MVLEAVLAPGKSVRLKSVGVRKEVGMLNTDGCVKTSAEGVLEHSERGEAEAETHADPVGVRIKYGEGCGESGRGNREVAHSKGRKR